MSKKATKNTEKIKDKDVSVLTPPNKKDIKAYTKYMVEQQDKVSIMIPAEQGDPVGATHTFQINGASFTYSIAELFKERWKVHISSADLRYASQKKKEALS